MRRLLLHLICLTLIWLDSSAAVADAPVVTALIHQLESKDRYERREAARTLAQFGADAAPAAQALGQALHDHDAQVWAAATDALAGLGLAARPAMEDLLRRLDMDKGQRLYRSAYAIAKVGPAAMPSLMERLDQADPRLCRGALIAVAHAGEAAAVAVPSLVRLLDHEDREMRELASDGLSAIGPAAEPQLKAALKTKTRRVQLGATRALARIGNAAARSLAELLPLTAVEDVELRAASLAALGAIAPDSDEVFEPLLTAMQDESPVVRKAAAAGWVQASPRLQSRAVPELARLLAKRQTIAANAAFVLGEFGPRAASATSILLNQLVTQPNSAELSRALGRVGRAAISPLMESIEQGTLSPQDASRVVREMPAHLRTEFNEQLHHVSPRVRETAVLNIANSLVNLSDTIASLVDALNDPSKNVRMAAARSLGMIGTPARTAHEPLIHQLRFDAAEDVRAVAIWAVGKAQPDEALLLAALSVAAADESPLVRSEVIQLLAELSQVPSSFRGCLSDSLQNATHPAVRSASIRAMSKIQADPELTVQALVRALDDAAPLVQRQALQTLPQLGKPATLAVGRVSDNLNCKDPTARIDAIKALAEFGENARPSFADVAILSTDANADVRLAVATAVPAIASKPEEAISVLTKLLVDPVKPIRQAAASELSAMQNSAASAVPALLAMLNRDEDAETARSALRRIAQTNEEAISALIQIIEDESTKQRTWRYALFYLEKLGPKASAALPVLRKRRETTDRGAKQRLERVIAQIEKAED